MRWSVFASIEISFSPAIVGVVCATEAGHRRRRDVAEIKRKIRPKEDSGWMVC